MNRLIIYLLLIVAQYCFSQNDNLLLKEYDSTLLPLKTFNSAEVDSLLVVNTQNNNVADSLYLYAYREYERSIFLKEHREVSDELELLKGILERDDKNYNLITSLDNNYTFSNIDFRFPNWEQDSLTIIVKEDQKYASEQFAQQNRMFCSTNRIKFEYEISQYSQLPKYGIFNGNYNQYASYLLDLIKQLLSLNTAHANIDCTYKEYLLFEAGKKLIDIKQVTLFRYNFIKLIYDTIN